MDLQEFLTKYVEGYLFEDLHSMAKITKLDDGKTAGGVGYPMVATALAGIELFGGLTCNTEVFDRNHGKSYFVAFWKLMYPSHHTLGSRCTNWCGTAWLTNSSRNRWCVSTKWWAIRIISNVTSTAT